MSSVYLDTNTLLGKWVKEHPYHGECQKIISYIDQGTYNGYISGLTLAEVASVVERQKTLFLLSKYKLTSLADEYLSAIVNIKNMNVIELLYHEDFLINANKLTLLAVNIQTMDIAKQIGLKTLDNMHIAIIHLFNKFRGRKIDYFITNDSDVLSKSKEILQYTEIEVVNPEDFVNDR